MHDTERLHIASHGDQVVMMQARGEIDLDSAVGLTSAVDSALARGANEIIIDMSGVRFMDSSGLRALLQSKELATENDVALSIEGLSGAAQRVLEITGTIDLLRRHS